MKRDAWNLLLKWKNKNGRKPLVCRDAMAYTDLGGQIVREVTLQLHNSLHDFARIE